jgi:hypothetical protein
MQRLVERGERIAAQAKSAAVERMVAQFRDQVRGIAIETGSGEIILRGRRLLARWLVDPALRFAAWRRG